MPAAPDPVWATATASLGAALAVTPAQADGLPARDVPAILAILGMARLSGSGTAGG